MSERKVPQPQAQSAYRVPRSRIDDDYDRAEQLPFVRVGAGEVTDVSGSGETCTVQFESGVEVGGIVVLGLEPGVGDWVEVHQRGDLLVVPEIGGGGGVVFVQPDDPGVHIIGTLWFDTDEVVP